MRKRILWLGPQLLAFGAGVSVASGQTVASLALVIVAAVATEVLLRELP